MRPRRKFDALGETKGNSVHNESKVHTGSIQLRPDWYRN